jgi:hypothetical protein
MNRKKIIAALCAISSIFTVGFVNYNGNYSIEKVAEQLNTWNGTSPVEKVYLQFDKPYYAVGDDIWFKAYVTVGGRHKLSVLSGVLNVELIDSRDSVVQHIKLPVVNGLTWGDFSLTDTLQEGNYRIRAYTNWMRNAGPDYFFDKHITIVNAVSNKVFTRSAFTFSTQNGQQKVSTQINYSDPDGIAYINREIRYTVQLNSKTVIKGKGITDDKGNLTISFINAQSAPLNSGLITTSLALDKENTITKTIPVRATSANVDVQFFPESGNLVNGIGSKVAFKAVSADGLGAAIKGTVLDSQNNIITTFNDQHLGMGVFSLTPQTGKSYKAHVVFADGSENTINLPPAIDKGYVLSIDNSDADNVKVKIFTSRPMLLDNADDTLSLLAQAGGEICFAAKSTPGSTNFIANVSKKHFPSGIVQFSLFSSKNGIMNERLVFIQNPDQLKLDVSSEKPAYAPQQNVNIKLNAKNGDGQPVEGSFSIAVVDETKVPFKEEDESTIISNLLLTSDLRGYIEQPNYYFTNVSAQTQADLDVLMLTQGYTRFDWKQILNDNFPPVVYGPEKTLAIAGHVKTNSGKPVANAKVSLISTKSGFFILDTVTNANGEFNFDNLVFEDSLKFLVEARTEKNRNNVQISLDNVSREGVNADKNAPDIKVNVNEGLAAYTQSSKMLFTEQLKYGLAKHTIVLKEVVIKSNRPVLKHSENLNGAGNADQILTADKIPFGCATLDVCLQGVLFGVNFRQGKPYSTRGGAMTINIDGVFVSTDEFQYMDASNIESIEVLRSGAYLSIYGSQAGAGGIILITTKRGDDADKSYLRQPAPGIIVYSPIGYYKSKEFYSPQYNDPKTNTAVADLRSTIYWNPNVITDKDGNAAIQYFNAGSKGTYRVIIEGIDGDGNIGRQVYHYKVE